MADISLVGCGLFPERHLTVEAVELLGKTEIYTILPTLAVERYLQRHGFAFHDLSSLYVEAADHREICRRIADAILAVAALKTRPISYLTYGHPMLFDTPAKLILSGAGKLGLSVNIVAGVSFVDSILAELGLSVDQSGLQIADATRLVAEQLPINPRQPLFLANVGALFHEKTAGLSGAAEQHVARLVGHLARSFPASQPATLCDFDEDGEAPLFLTVRLEEVPALASGLSYATTLLIAPIAPSHASS